MEIVDIYGHISDGSELVIGVGNYNNIHGLACYFPERNHLISEQWPGNDLLLINPISEVIAPSVLQLILKYENIPNDQPNNKIYFSLSVKDSGENQVGTKKYINVDIGSDKQACATVSTEKAIFSIDYSIVDNCQRSKLLAGSLYSLETMINKQKYIVSWKIQGFSNGDLIIFLPTTWYENDGQETNSSCRINSGVINLIERLNQLQFRGYSTKHWCEKIPQITNCDDNNICGKCFGRCLNTSHICYPKLIANKDEIFICGSPNSEIEANDSSSIVFANTFDTLIVFIIILFLVILLAWYLTKS